MDFRLVNCPVATLIEEAAIPFETSAEINTLDSNCWKRVFSRKKVIFILLREKNIQKTKFFSGLL